MATLMNGNAEDSRRAGNSPRPKGRGKSLVRRLLWTHTGGLHIGGLPTDNVGEEQRTQKTLSAGTSQFMAIVVMKRKVFLLPAHES